MFKNLTSNFSKIFDKIRKNGTITESQIDAAMRDIRVALLEADVALPALKDFISKVSEKAKGQEIIRSVSPAQMIIKIINDEMITFLEPDPLESKLNLHSNPPVNILVAGLQGSGKTTASAKLALKLKNQNKKVLLVSLDTYRPAAQEQLEILAKNINIDSLPIIREQKPLEIAKRAISEAKRNGYDIVLYDTAGRLHIDDEMIEEAISIKQLISPIETLLVIDSMIGQDAVNVASNFDTKLGITGVILSRIDGDSRGGAALSIRYATGKPIKFLSIGEKPQEFEEFDAKRITSRILDMGDIVSFVEKASEAIDKEEAEKAAARFKKGKFDLNDYMSQLKMIKKMGGFGNILSMLPGVSKLTSKLGDLNSNNKILSHQEAIFFSMTKKERKNPDLLNASRRKRIATGSGTSIQQVNMMLKQFQQISDMIKKASRMDQKTLMRSYGHMLGKK